MKKRLILFLIRKRIRVKKYQWFKFIGQKSRSAYYFTDEGLLKIEPFNLDYIHDKDTVTTIRINCRSYMIRRAGVSLNWLLDDECEIEIFTEKPEWIR